jgi:hypothetical protein
MPDPWDKIGHDVLDKPDNEPIKANPTSIAKYGAPSVALVTAVLAALLGEATNLDPRMPAVVFAAAIIIAAVVLGVYVAFATDIRTRGAVTIARFESIARLAESEEAKRADAAVAAQKAAEAALASTNAELEKKTIELDRAKDELTSTKLTLGLLTRGDEITSVLAAVVKETNVSQGLKSNGG